MSFTHGVLPDDGFKGSQLTSSGYRFRPAFRHGQRLSGTVALPLPGGRPTGVTYRFLVDGQVVGNSIDTTLWPDGTHVIACQVMENPSGAVVHNGSIVVVFNNSGTPYQGKLGQAVIAEIWGGASHNSLAWGRVDVSDPVPYPLDPQLDKHPIATNETDRNRLAWNKIWWVEGLNHAPTRLYKTLPILMKNKHGDYFIKNFNPMGGGAGITPANAKPFVEQAPAYDGPRGVGFINPYASINPYFYDKLASGNFGWVGVDKSGRVFTVDITGEVRTLLGPRSVAGVVGTDCDEHSVNLDARLANGEKEYIGNMNGKRLVLSHDIWPCSSFPFEGIIADTGNNCVTEIHFKEQRLMRRWPLAGVTSVCDSFELQQDRDLNIIWVAVNPEGLWCQRHTTAPEGTNTHPITGGSHGTFTGHVPTLEKLVDIPNAFWVRCFGERIFVLTKTSAIYEYNVRTKELVQRFAPIAPVEPFVFMSIDTTGSIGPIGRIYFGRTGGNDRTTMRWLDTTNWTNGKLDATHLANKVIHGSFTALTDPMGHYMWGMAIHPTLPKFLVCGITSSSWFMWTGCLGAALKLDAAIPYDGTADFHFGRLDKWLGLATIFGFSGHGNIGYSCDMFRDYETYAEARTYVRSVLDPLFPASMAESAREAVAKQMFAQRTRKHYQDGIPVVVPDPEPEPEPEPEPQPEPLVLNSVSISGGTPPYVVSVMDSKGQNVVKNVS